MHIKLWLENLKGRDHFKDLGTDRRIILEIGCECMNWIHLAGNRDQWWVLVNMVMKLQVP
jgi:hypothetical protein